MDAALRLLLLCESLVVFSLITGAQSQAQGFNLQETGRSENAITLTCTDSTSMTGIAPVPDPQFFRGPIGMRMRVDNQNGFNREGNVLTFQITRELEDEYTCGTPSVQSNSLALIGKPIKYIQVGEYALSADCLPGPL